MRKGLVLLLVLLLMLSALPVSAESKNAAREVSINGDFEMVDPENNLPESWVFHSYEAAYNGRTEVSSASCEQDPERGNVVHITSSEEDDAALYREVKVTPSSFYKLTCWIRTSGVEGGAGANIALRDIVAVSNSVFGDSDWTMVELVGKTGPSQTSMTVSCRLGGYGATAKGEAWFDGFEMEKLDNFEGEYVPFYSGEVADDNGGEGENGSALTIVIIIIAVLAVTIAALTVILIVKKKSGGPQEIPPIESYAEDKVRKLPELGNYCGRSFFSTNDDTMPERTDLKLRFTKRDRLFVLVLTGVYAVIALIRLGTLSFPTKAWTGNTGDSVRIEFGRSVSLKEIWQNSGISHTKYKLVTDNGTEIKFSDKDGTEYGHMFRWTSVAKTSVSNSGETTGVTLVVLGGDSSRPNQPDLVMLELAFFDQDGLVSCTASGDAAYLVDEQDTVPETPSYYNGMYFDELYHGRTALEHIENLPVYEWTHPPLGKLIIAIGILIFGMKPFGWRIMGVLFGIAMVPILYMMAKRLLKKSELALFSTFLFTFDFMHFTQTRIATIDVYAVFFILLMSYFMLEFISMDIGDSVKDMLRPLALSGVFMGLGCASKWICIYTSVGLAVLLFAKLIVMGIKSYRLGKLKKYAALRLPARFWKTVSVLTVWCVLFFVIVPAAIYSASYFRYYTAQWKPAAQQKIYNADPDNYESPDDVKLSFDQAVTAYFGEKYTTTENGKTVTKYKGGVLGNQFDIFNYHSGLKSEHSASSTWWMWLMDLRPTWFYVGERGTENSVKYVGTIDSFGNPAVWTACNAATLILIIVLLFVVKRFPVEPWFIFVSIASAFLPWVLVPRSTYSYHFFATVPFICLAAGYLVGCLEDRKAAKITAAEGDAKAQKGRPGKLKYIWMAIALVLFGLFFPVLSGVRVRENYIYALQWVPYHKWEITTTDENGKETTKNYRIGWTFISYEMSDPKNPDRYITRIKK